MVLKIEWEKITVLLNFLETTGRNVAMECDIAKLLRVALRTVFCVVSPSSLVVNRSPRLYFWLQKSSITCAVTSTVKAKFKVQSNGTCAYIRSIRNYGILIYCYTRAARTHTEQYHATLRLRDTVRSYLSTAHAHGRLSMDFEMMRLVQSSVYFLNQE